jgi:hypothetical protein
LDDKLVIWAAGTMDLSDKAREKAIIKLKYFLKYNNNGSIEKEFLR